MATPGAPSDALEAERWVQAAQRVLTSSGQAMHYLEIKRVVTENNLVPPGIKTTIEAALLNEVQRPGSRLIHVDSQSGIFKLATEAEKLAQLEAHKKAKAQNQGVKGQHPPKVKSRPAQGQSGGSSGPVDKYRIKYLRLKKYIKHMVFLNASLCDEVVKADEAVAQVREQRRYLIRRLQQFQALPEVVPTAPARVATPQQPLAAAASPALAAAGTPGSATGKPVSPAVVPPGKPDVKPDLEKIKGKKKTLQGGKKRAAKDGLPLLPGETVKVKPKKTKGGSNKRLVLSIPLDSTGRPIFPIELGPLTIHSLGEITYDRSGYHSTEHIYPVGFCSTRLYASLQNPQQRCLYTCKILDTGSGPKFEVSPEDAPDQVISCDSADECHTQLLSYINGARGVQLVTPEPRGAEFFGFSHPTVQNLIQCYPGARKCSSYKWVKFEVCRADPREAAIFFDDDPVINFEALQQSRSFLQGMEQQKPMQQMSSILEPSSSLRSLLTSGPLIQTTQT